MRVCEFQRMNWAQGDMIAEASSSNDQTVENMLDVHSGK